MENILPVHINSNECMQLSSIDNANIMYELVHAIQWDPQKTRVELGIRGISIAKSYYAVGNTNNRFNMTFDGQEYEFTLTPANYNVYTLRTELHRIINLQAPSSVSITYDQPTNKYSFTVQDYSQAVSIDWNMTHSGYKVVGFNKESYAFTTSGSDMVLTAVNCANVKAINTLNIATNFVLPNVRGTRGEQSRTLYKIYFDQPDNYSIYTKVFENPEYHEISPTQPAIKNISMQLVNDDGELMNLNGVDWEATLNFRFLPVYDEDTHYNKVMQTKQYNTFVEMIKLLEEIATKR